MFDVNLELVDEIVTKTNKLIRIKYFDWLLIFNENDTRWKRVVRGKWRGDLFKEQSMIARVLKTQLIL